MDIVDYVSFKEVFCSIMGIKSSPNNASDDLTCHLNLSYRIEEEFDPEISDFEKTIIINDDDLKHEYDKAVEALIINFIRTLPTFIRTCADECGNPIP